VTKWLRFHCSRRTTKRPSNKRRALGALAGLFPALVVADWRIDSADGATPPRAVVRDADGVELALKRAPDDNVYLEFTSVGFAALSRASCPTLQIDTKRPLHHFSVGARCAVAGRRAIMTLGQVEDRTLRSNLVEQLMNGITVSVRFVSADGSYHQAEFALTRSARAIRAALGRDVRVRAR
jgi:hypothetical protein